MTSLDTLVDDANCFSVLGGKGWITSHRTFKLQICTWLKNKNTEFCLEVIHICQILKDCCALLELWQRSNAIANIFQGLTMHDTVVCAIQHFR